MSLTEQILLELGLTWYDGIRDVPDHVEQQVKAGMSVHIMVRFVSVLL